MNDRQTAARFDVVDAPTTPAQVAANVALIFFRCDVFDLHDRLQQNGFALSKSIFHGEDRRHFERELAGVDFVERADRKSTRLNSSHANISYAVFCLKKKKI